MCTNLGLICSLTSSILLFYFCLATYVEAQYTKYVQALLIFRDDLLPMHVWDLYNEMDVSSLQWGQVHRNKIDYIRVFILVRNSVNNVDVLPSDYLEVRIIIY